MEQRITKIQEQIKELQDWFNRSQQLIYPLDEISRKIIQKDMLVATGRIVSAPTFDITLEVSFNRRVLWVFAKEV